jgi:hypothetical protein
VEAPHDLDVVPRSRQARIDLPQDAGIQDVFRHLADDRTRTEAIAAELRDAFMAEAEASHRPASQVVRELMREFIKRQRQAREYDAVLRAKVDTARAQVASGQVASDAEVEARFAARRAALRVKAGSAEG